MELSETKHVSGREKLAVDQHPLDTLSTAFRHPEPEPEPEQEPEQEKDGGGGGSREIVFFGDDLGTLTNRILNAMGAEPVTRKTSPKGRRLGGVEDQAAVSRWIAAGLSPDEIVANVGECVSTAQSPPNSFKYFERSMARLIDAKQAPIPVTIAPKGRAHAKPSAFSRERLGPIIAGALASAKPV